MQTLLTGTPGAGKTLYTVGKLLLPLIGASVVEHLDDGSTVEHPRRIFSNINGLQIEHDLVEAGPSWVSKGKDSWEQGEGNRKGLHNWHEWAPPGAVIVVDEFQKIWPPRPNGAPVPPDVQAMDTHRHLGVDFILISQKFSFDNHIAGLIGRHLHIRRIANFPVAICYEWDHCSRSLLYSKSISKSPFRYKRAWYKLYISARVHTKQPRKTPALAYVILGALAIAAWKVPETYARIAGKGKEHQERMAALTGAPPAAAPGAPGAPRSPLPGGAAPVPMAPASAPVPVEASIVGCVQAGDDCRCFDADGLRVYLLRPLCLERLPQGGPSKVVERVPELRQVQAMESTAQVDGDVWSSMRRR